MTQGITSDLAELIAYQRYAPSIRYQPHAFATRAGQHVCKLRGRGMDFTEARHYQFGDDIRHMEWRVTARTGKPHVKVYQEERERPVVLLVDFNSSMFFGTRIAFKSVTAARLAALLAWTAAKQGDRVGGLLVSLRSHHEYMPRARQAGVLPFLVGLSKYTHQQGASTPAASSHYFNDALTRLHRVIKPGSIVVLVSDFYTLTRDCYARLSQLARYHDVLAYHVCDPLECETPKAGAYAFTDGDKELFLDTSMDAVRFRYQFDCDERIRSTQEMLQRFGAQYTQVLSTTDLPLLVRQTFPWRQHV